MPEASQKHPIRRIREAFKSASEASGLRQYRSSEGFAELVGRSSSTIRNVECGFTKKWDRLAKQIESMTGVSADWQLGNPHPFDPILGVDGEAWNPEQHLDYLGGNEINWRVLLMTSPNGAAKLASKIVEIKIVKDLGVKKRAGGGQDTEFLTELAKLFDKYGCLRDDDVGKLVAETLCNDLDQIVSDLVMATSKALKRSEA